MGLADFVVALGCGSVRGCRDGGGRREDLAVCAGLCGARGCDKIGLRWSGVFLHDGARGELRLFCECSNGSEEGEGCQ